MVFEVGVAVGLYGLLLQKNLEKLWALLPARGSSLVMARVRGESWAERWSRSNRLFRKRKDPPPYGLQLSFALTRGCEALCGRRDVAGDAKSGSGVIAGMAAAAAADVTADVTSDMTADVAEAETVAVAVCRSAVAVVAVRLCRRRVCRRRICRRPGAVPESPHHNTGLIARWDQWATGLRSFPTTRRRSRLRGCEHVWSAVRRRGAGGDVGAATVISPRGTSELRDWRRWERADTARWGERWGQCEQGPGI